MTVENGIVESNVQSPVTPTYEGTSVTIKGSICSSKSILILKLRGTKA